MTTAVTNLPGDEPVARFRTLQERDAGEKPDNVLYEGVPDHLREPLLRWWTNTAAGQPRTCERVLSRFRLDAGSFRAHPTASTTPKPYEVITLFVERQEGLALDLINAFVGMHPYWDGPMPNIQEWQGRLADLEQRLIDAGSAWMVDKELRGLYRRVDPVVVKARRTAEAAARAAGRPTAAEHLRNAWHEVYGVHPDPTAAYREAVLAVEAASIPVVSPNNGRATLGTVIRDMRSQAWQLTLVDTADQPGDASPFIDMIEQLWKGQRSRHAGGISSRDQTQGEAEAAVHLAALAVQWFTSNAVHKK